MAHRIWSGLVCFANSRIGMMLIAALIGALGLFTWQRQDWLFKQRHMRAELMLDHQLNLVERINTEVGTLVSAASSISAPITKGGVSDAQTNEAIRYYNSVQGRWFGMHGAFETSLEFYFPGGICEAFDQVVESTQALDISLRDVRSPDGARASLQACEDVREALRAWNVVVLSHMGGDG